MRELVAAALLVIAFAAVVPAAEDDVSFERSIAPIFAKRCLSCHNASDKKGELSLQTRADLLAGGESGPVVKPSEPQASPLLDAVSGDKPDMPKKGPPLSKDEVAALRRWIAAGARWPEALELSDLSRADMNWWSLKPITKPAVPALSEAEERLARTPVDAFILARLREQGLSFSAEADRRTLIRRLSFDLLGLPPTPQEIEAFEKDADPRAYEKLVDRLLDSPRYGERWARHWLDVVHYGDTHGYDKDKRRPHSWPYRDYVIRALNDDRPYGRFVQEQLAADVLYPNSPESIPALGFIAAGPWDFVGHVELREGTVDKQITRSLDRDDMVMNTMSTFTSLTVHCARCHNHKFDPITQEDYYSLQAVFAGVERADRPYGSDRAVARQRRELVERKQSLEEKQKTLDAKIAALKEPELVRLDAQLEAVRKRLAPRKDSPTNGYHSAIMPTADHVKWVQVDLGAAYDLEKVVLVSARPTDFPDAPGFGFPARFKVEASGAADFKTPKTLADHTREDFANPGDKPFVIEGAALSGVKTRYVRVTATRLWKRTNDFVFALAELQASSEGSNVAPRGEVTALDSIEAGRWSRKHLVDGFSSRAPLEAQGKLPVESESKALLGKLIEQRQKLLETLLDEPTRREIAETATALEQTKTDLALLPPEQLVYAAASTFAPQGSFTPPPGGMPRPINVLVRGSVKSPGKLVSPGAVGCVSALPARFSLENADDEASRRAGLAKWIVDRQNPLTWRSIVNRVWHYHFGSGLVDTPNDFGSMGSLPTHPELLDWLAGDFRDGDQSLKRLHKLLVMSAVYRQSSADNPAAAKTDAGNRWLWRMNRRRLDAESIRDAVLAVSGKLDLAMFGPGYDLFGFKDDHSPHYLYDQANIDDPKTFRRTVYRFVVRSVPDPLMECLDCADPSLNVPVRNTTITALQALALLNNPFLVKQAEHLAARVEPQRTDMVGRITVAFELALGRPPRNDEGATLLTYAEKHGLANACRLILNMNEFIFID